MTMNDLRLLEYAADKNNPKLELNGVLVDVEEEALVATNTRTLVMIKEDKENLSDRTMIISKIAFTNALRAIPKSHWTKARISQRVQKDGEGEIVVGVIETDQYSYGAHDNTFVPAMQFGASEIFGKFPGYKRITPFDIEKTFVVGEKFPNSQTYDGAKWEESTSKRFEVSGELLSYQIARTGTVIDRKLLDPVAEYIKKECGDQAEAFFKHQNLPIVIVAGRAIITIMPIVY